MVNPIDKIRSFYTSIVGELAKCTWPTWQELYESTVVVIVSSVLLSLFVLVVDVVIRQLVRLVT